MSDMNAKAGGAHKDSITKCFRMATRLNKVFALTDDNPSMRVLEETMEIEAVCTSRDEYPMHTYIFNLDGELLRVTMGSVDGADGVVELPVSSYARLMSGRRVTAPTEVERPRHISDDRLIVAWVRDNPEKLTRERRGRLLFASAWEVLNAWNSSLTVPLSTRSASNLFQRMSYEIDNEISRVLRKVYDVRVESDGCCVCYPNPQLPPGVFNKHNTVQGVFDKRAKHG